MKTGQEDGAEGTKRGDRKMSQKGTRSGDRKWHGRDRRRDWKGERNLDQ